MLLRHKLSILVWKHLNEQISNFKWEFLTVLSPTFFALILIIGRYLITCNTSPVRTFEPIGLNGYWQRLVEELDNRAQLLGNNPNSTNIFSPRKVIAFSSKSDAILEQIMVEGAVALEGVQLSVMADCDTVRKAIVKDNLLVGVCLSWLSEDAKPDDGINILLIFPSELRHFDDMYIGVDWDTNSLYDLLDKNNNRMLSGTDGGYVGYVREGFIQIQYCISNTYIKYLNRIAVKKEEIPDVTLQRFPIMHTSKDDLQGVLKMGLSIVILIGYFYPIVHFTYSMVFEKQTQLKSIIKHLNISNTVYYLSWFIRGLIPMFIGGILLQVILQVHWNQGAGIINKSSFFPVFLCLFAYITSGISFSLILSALFRRSVPAAKMTGLFWILTYLPFTAISIVQSFKYGIYTVTILFSNTVMGLIFRNIIEFEKEASGLQWNCFFAKSGFYDNIPTGYYVLLLFVQSLVYFLIALYIEELIPGGYGVAKRWNFLCRIKSDRSSTSLTNAQKKINFFKMGQARIYENQYGSKVEMVEINHLTKTINDEVLVFDVNFKLHENEITVLMGHNGAGKTMLLMMIVGSFNPSFGTVIIDGNDMFSDPHIAKKDLGVFMHPTALYEYLSVDKQMEFFCRMKGLNPIETESEVNKYLLAMNLWRKRRTLTKNLTLGFKQILGICCALIGNSKIVIMDDPSSHLDMSNRQLFWDLLISEKKNRTILITTHSAHDAEVLGDRVAVITQGHITCLGSSSFLKKIYNEGYRLVCTKKKYCDSYDVMLFVQNYFPDVEPEGDNSIEISYILPDRNMELCLRLIDDLEKNIDRLNLQYIKFSECSLEDVFMKVGAADAEFGNNIRHFRILNGKPNEDQDILKFKKIYTNLPLKGFSLWLNHCRAMFYKILIYMLRSKTIIAIQIISPLLITILSCLASELWWIAQVLNPITYNSLLYTECVVLIEKHLNLREFMNKVAESYRQINALNSDIMIIDTNNELFTEYYTSIELKEEVPFNYKYVYAATFANNSITAWFNNDPLHTAPISLNSVFNAILRAMLNTKAQINLRMEPLPFQTAHVGSLFYTTEGFGSVLSRNLTLCLCVLWPFSVYNNLKENRRKFKILQYISFLHPATFVFSSYCYDILRMTVSAILIYITLLIIELNSLLNIEISYWYLVVLLCAAACFTSCNMLLSTLFSDPLVAYTFISAFYLYGMICAETFTEIYETSKSGSGGTTLLFESIISFNPGFTLNRALLKIVLIERLKRMCEDPNISDASVAIDTCSTQPRCCENTDMTSIKNGIGIELIYLVITNLLALLIFSLCHLKIKPKCKFRQRKTQIDYDDYIHRHDPVRKTQMLDEVLQERIDVITMKPYEYHQCPTVCYKVDKLYGHFELLRRIYFRVQRAEVLGVLGLNSCGKSQLIKILTGTIKPSSGEIYTNGFVMSQNARKILRRIGYCPASNPLLEFYTGKELMVIIGLLRGIRKDNVDNVCELIAKLMGFNSHMNMKIRVYSDGMKSRLSCGLAILGYHPSVVYLDEPTSSVDLAGARKIWFTLGILTEFGTSVVFTSQHPEQCQFLCNRMAIMSKKTIRFIGTPQFLIQTYCAGYLLEIKLKEMFEANNDGVEELNESQSWNSILSVDKRKVRKIGIITFVEQSFPNSYMSEHHGRIFKFFIYPSVITIAEIIKIMLNNFSKFNLESFSINQNKLQSMFLNLVEWDKETKLI